jgi:hypothetical protein
LGGVILGPTVSIQGGDSITFAFALARFVIPAVSANTRRGHPPTAQTPFPPTPTTPIFFFDFSKSLENSKNFPDYREYSKYCEYRIKVSKIQVEREGGVGDQ